MRGRRRCMKVKKTWPKVVNIYWCPECNVPLLRSICDKCKSKGFKLKMTEPCDARPAFTHDIELLRKTITSEFGSETAYTKLMGDGKFILVNKGTYLDDLKEIFVDGNLIGKLYFNPFTHRWKFRLDYAGAVKLVQENLVPTYRLKPGEKVRENIYLGLKEGYKKGQQVVILNSKGDVIGVGRVGLKGDLRVVKLYRVKVIHETSGKPASMNDLYKANEYQLYYLESRAKTFLYVMSTKINRKPVVSYSGGKDSLVTLDLTLSTLGDVELLFNDTGLELPETIRNVYEVADGYGLNLNIASAGDAFWKSVKQLGPPARDYRWCCKVCKLVPLAKLIMSKWKGEIVNIVGQRAFESLDRAKSPRVWRNKWVPSLLSMSPIQEWSQLAEWIYIYVHGLKPNILYFKGFERLGCYLCPASRLAEFKVVEETHPELWSKWENFLVKWAKKVGLPKAWIRLGLWRWLGPSSTKKVLSSIIERYRDSLLDWKSYYSKWIKPAIESKQYLVTEEGKHIFIVKLSDRVKLELVIRQYALFSTRFERVGKEVKMKTSRGEVTVNEEGTIKVIASTQKDAIETAIEVLKAYYRALYCTECGSCSLWCPLGASTLDPHITIDPTSCTGCKTCLEVCPVADVTFEHIIAALLLDDCRAWKRKTKTRRSVIVGSLKILATISQEAY